MSTKSDDWTERFARMAREQDEIPALLRDVVPTAGSLWAWEPLKAHARQEVRVTAVKWNGEEVWVEYADERGHLYSNELSRWVEATVLLQPAPEDA